MPQNDPRRGASKATNIVAGPSRNKLAQLIELLTGVPTDPDWYRNASREEIFMNTVPQIAPAIMGAGTRVAKTLSSLPDASPNAIKRDPFGLSDAPMERREFIDRITGRTTDRAGTKLEQLFDASQDVTSPTWNEDFTKAADFAESFNKKYGWPNAVVNPEAIGTWRDPSYKGQVSGVFDEIANVVKDRLLPKNIKKTKDIVIEHLPQPHRRKR